MAFLASAHRIAFGKFACVEIGMAVATVGEFEGGALFPGGMTFVAGDGGVFPLKRVARFAVVEFCFVGHMPTAGGVTILTVVPQLTFMNICMAISAVAKLKAGELDETGVGWSAVVDDIGVALCTRDAHVLSVKREFCFGVIEEGGWFPASSGVTGRASGGQLPTVFVSVTA